MKPEYAVNPGVSIGPILLDRPREEVREILGEPDYVEAAHERWGIEFPDKDCFVESCIQVRYLDNKVDDIQLSGHSDFICTLAGIPVHDSTVEEVASAAEGISPRDREAKEFPFTYSYPGIGLSFWREDADKHHFDTVNLTKPNSEQGAAEQPATAGEST